MRLRIRPLGGCTRRGAMVVEVEEEDLLLVRLLLVAF